MNLVVVVVVDELVAPVVWDPLVAPVFWDPLVMALLSKVKDCPKASTHLESKMVTGVRLTVLMGPRSAWAVLD